LWWRSYTLVACAMIALARGEPAEATGYLHESLRLRDALGDVFGLAQSFNVLADAAEVEGYATRAARLRGAAERAWRSTGVTVTGSGYHRARGRETAARPHSQLGEEPFATAVQDGARLTLQQALTYALEGDAPPASPPVQP